MKILYILLVIAFNIYYVAFAIPKNCEYDSQDLNEEYDSLVNIYCYGSNCNINDNNVILSNGVLTIDTPGSYMLHGNLNGQVYIESDEKDFIHLFLHNVTINSPNNAAIYIAIADKVTITMIGSNVIINDNNQYLNNDYALIYSNSNLTFNGTGSLIIKSENSGTIYCNKILKIINSKITIEGTEIYEIISNETICLSENNIIEYKTIENSPTSSIPRTSISTKTLPTAISSTIPSISVTSKTLTTSNSTKTLSTTNPGKTIHTTTATKTLPAGGGTCPTNIINMGYKCCPLGCVVVYVDKYGFWGVRNNQWCGCGGGSYYGYSCSNQILVAGYPCCSYTNCRLITKDSMGRWGVENNKWCGLTNHCIT